jgi:hypothetical protein
VASRAAIKAAKEILEAAKTASRIDELPGCFSLEPPVILRHNLGPACTEDDVEADIVGTAGEYAGRIHILKIGWGDADDYDIIVP